MDPDENVTISRADVVAMIGLTANVEAFARVGDVSPVAQTKIQRRLARDPTSTTQLCSPNCWTISPSVYIGHSATPESTAG